MTQSVLIPVDIEHPESWSVPAQMVASWAAGADTKVHALYVLPGIASSLMGSYFPKDFEKEALDKARQRLEGIVTADLPKGIAKPEHHVLHGDVYRQIITGANDIGVDVIALLAHRPGMADYLLGSNAARIARHAHQTVLLVRG